MEFGKNRVQYKEFDWFSYTTEAYDVYYYTGGRELAQSVFEMADDELEYVQGLVDYRIDSRLKYIVYNNYSDFKQTNIGVKLEENVNVGGYTPFIGNRAFVYFDGSHEHFRERIRAATAAVVLNDMVYGGSIQERLQNSALLNLPTWYMEGLIHYVAQDWNVTQHERLREGILDEQFEHFNALSKEDAVLVGHSLWKYIAEQYGKEALANILYITRVNKNMESGFLFVLGQDFESLQEQWYQYHQRLFLKERSLFDSLETRLEPRPKRRFRKRRLTQARISPSGRYLAFVTNYDGKFKVWAYDIERRRKDKIIRRGYRQDEIFYDESYPLIEWKPNEDILTLMYDKLARPHVMQYDPEKRKKLEERRIFRMEKVLSFDYHQDGRNIVLSGIRRGQSDIYAYDFRSNIMRPLTNDVYDDLEPRFIDESRGVVFRSNRPNDSVDFRNTRPSGRFAPHYNLYYLDFKFRGVTEELAQVTYTDDLETEVRMYDATFFTYITQENGIRNVNFARHDSLFDRTEVIATFTDTAFKSDTFHFATPDTERVRFSIDPEKRMALDRIDTTVHYRDTFYHHQWTNYARNINLFDVQPRTRQVLTIQKQHGDNQISLTSYPDTLTGRTEVRPQSRSYALLTKDELTRTGPLSEQLLEEGETARDSALEGSADPSPDSLDALSSPEVYFLSRFGWDYHPDSMAAQRPGGNPEVEANEAAAPRRKFSSSRPYFLEFTPDYLVTQLDYSILNTPYKPFDGNLGFPRQGSFNGMFKLSISDLFQDYRIMGGVRVPANLNGLDVFVSYHNLRKRLDKELIYYRQSNTIANELSAQRQRNQELRYMMTYPFSEIAAIKGGPFVRLDQYIPLSSEQGVLNNGERGNVYWIGTHLEYVFDNTIPRGLNLRHGLRFKIYLDYFRDITYTQPNYASLNPQENSARIPDGGLELSVLGADFRHYQKIHRQIIWANRVAGAQSFGRQDVLFLLGGVDNWLFNLNVNQNLQPDPSRDFMFKAQATNLRGFPQNARNGNAVAVWNSEIRIPIFQYLYNRPLKSSFFNDFQLIGFTDVGTAWTGPSPYSDQNSFNRTERRESYPISYEVVSLRDPIAIGYGPGLRTSLLGYFIRTDYAWGYEDGLQLDPTFYFSIGTDF